MIQFPDDEEHEQRIFFPAESPTGSLAELLDALRKLANESAGFLAMGDPVQHGYTNMAVLRQRIEQARDVLAKWEERS